MAGCCSVLYDNKLHSMVLFLGVFSAEKHVYFARYTYVLLKEKHHSFQTSSSFNAMSNDR